MEDLAGVRLTARRVQRAAEASGTAAAEAVRERSALIADRKIVPLPPCPLPDMVYGVIDGTGVPMTAAEIAVNQYVQVFDYLRATALSSQASRAMLGSATEEFT